MADCLNAEIIAALRSGLLLDAERLRAEQHCAECPACRQLVAIGSGQEQTLIPALMAEYPAGTMPRITVEPRHVQALAGSPVLGRRYHIVNELGRGGMGVVYRAIDRLTDQQVALKCVSRVTECTKEILPSPYQAFDATTPAQPSPLTATLASGPSVPGVPADPDHDELALRLALAQEFKTLASLRHPHIVSVLDYGFDQQGAPFFTMELLANASPLASAKKGTLEERVSLLLQILQALVYLHRRSVLHRDIKPANVLITGSTTGPHVKLLDFGVSILKQNRFTAGVEVAGTLGYIAPEVLLGEAVSEASDLYSFGVVACELLTGTPLFQEQDAAALVATVLSRQPSWDETLLTPALNAILHRLLAKTVEARYPSAEEAARAIAQAMGLSATADSAAVRESFLQAADFVGRDTELQMLRRALGGAGSAWLVGGESGVGKSRLLDELRTWALVHGCLVLRGQTNRNGSAGFNLLVEPLRFLCLEVSLEPLEVSVLKSLLPDLPRLLGREIADAPVLDGQAARLRLLEVLSTVLLRVARPTLLLLEDLQWADADSMELLRLLTTRIGQRPLLLVGSYRNDEKPDFPSALPSARALPLPRLDRNAVRRLSASMLGHAEPSSEMVELLWRETEGNTFFLVEVTRSLAEEAGSLAAISQVALPQRIFAGGVDAVLQRRLQRVPEAAQPLLRLAAIAGRQLDLLLLSTFCSDLDEVLRSCADVAVLEVSEQQWRFCHDKLRERLLADMSLSDARGLHQQVAQALERIYTDDETQAARIGYHYDKASNYQRAAHYLTQAGELAVRRGALAEAESVLKQADTLHRHFVVPAAERFRVCRLLVYALVGLGRMGECAETFERALAATAHPIPRSTPGLALALLGQVGRQALHRLHSGFIRPPNSSDEAALFFELVNLHRVGVELNGYRAELLAAAYSSLQSLNLAERHGDAQLCAAGYAAIGYFLVLTPLKSLSLFYLERGHALADKLHGTAALQVLLRAAALVHESVGEQPRALFLLKQALPLAEELGDLHGQLHAMLIQTSALIFKSDYAEAIRQAEIMMKRASLPRNEFYLTMTYGILGAIALRQGRLTDAELHLRQARSLVRTQTATLLPVYIDCMSVLCASRRGEQARVSRELAGAVRLVENTDLTAHHLLDGYPGVVEACLQAWQRASDPVEQAQLLRMHARATRALRRYSFIFPIGRPAHHLFTGRYHLVRGASELAQRHFLTAQQHAERLGMLHEAALASAWLAKSIRGTRGIEKMKRAKEVLEKLDAAWDEALG